MPTSKTPSPIRRRPALYAAILAFLFFLLYFYTAPRSNVSYADSDLLTIIGYQLGVAHPPGYPYLVFLIYFLTHLPLPFSIALKANLVSIIFHSLTLFVLFLTNFNLIELFTHKKTKFSFFQKIVISTISTTFLALNFLFWLYSIIAEKYALNDFFISITLFLIVKLLKPKLKHKNRYWLALFTTASIALGHHHTYLLFLPALALLCWRSRLVLKTLVKPALTIFFSTQIIFIASLLFLNSHQAFVSWNFEPTPQGLYRMITRRDFTGYQIIEGKYRGIYLDPVTIPEIITKIPLHAQVFIDNFGWAATLLTVIGFFTLVKTKHKLKPYLLLIFLSTTLFIPMYLDWPNNLSTQGIRVRLYLTGWVSLPLIITLAITRLTYSFLSKTTLINSTLALLALACFFQLSSTFNQINLRNFDLISNFYQNSLQSLPPNTLFSCQSDTSCFATLYSQQINHVRPDVFILPHGNSIIKRQLDQNSHLHTFPYPQNPELYLDYLTTSIKTRPVFITEIQQIYYQLLGINYGFFNYIPNSYVGQLTTSPPDTFPEPDYSFSNLLANQSFPKQDYFRQQLKASIAQKHLLNARIYAQLKQPQIQIDQELELATNLSQDLPAVYQQDVINTQKLVASFQFQDQYVPEHDQPNHSQIYTQAKEYISLNQGKLAFLGLSNILWQDPSNLEVRQTLAELYQHQGYLQEAITEYQNILLINPNNQYALDQLNRLKAVELE